jgi:hypothetical protein
LFSIGLARERLLAAIDEGLPLLRGLEGHHRPRKPCRLSTWRRPPSIAVLRGTLLLRVHGGEDLRAAPEQRRVAVALDHVLAHLLDEVGRELVEDVLHGKTWISSAIACVVLGLGDHPLVRICPST